MIYLVGGAGVSTSSYDHMAILCSPLPFWHKDCEGSPCGTFVKGGSATWIVLWGLSAPHYHGCCTRSCRASLQATGRNQLGLICLHQQSRQPQRQLCRHCSDDSVANICSDIVAKCSSDMVANCSADCVACCCSSEAPTAAPTEPPTAVP